MSAGTSKNFPRKTTSPKKSPVSLTAFEKEVVAFFEDFAHLLGLQPSVAQIYGLLYCRAAPVTFENLRQCLKISLGSASQGLKYLQERGLVRVEQTAGARQKAFVAEIGLGQIVNVMLREQIAPRLAGGRQRLEKMATSAGGAGVSDEQVQRVERLRRWVERADEVLPMVLKFAGGG